MTSARILVISISWAVLSAAPLICAPDVKPSKATVILQPRSGIQELELQRQRFLGFSLQADPVSAPLIDTQDLSRYREFQFGMNLLAVAKQAGMELSAARVIHQRPALIQELDWRPQFSLRYSPQADSVKSVLFSFYDGELFRVVVNYDADRTEGMTTKDMIAAISAKYGTATRPAAEIIFSSSQIYNDSEVVIARWEDAQYSFNLFRIANQPTFGMIAFEKRQDALARAAIVESIRLDEQEAPQREVGLQKKHDGENRLEQEKARLPNKTSFRP